MHAARWRRRAERSSARPCSVSCGVRTAHATRNICVDLLLYRVTEKKQCHLLVWSTASCFLLVEAHTQAGPSLARVPLFATDLVPFPPSFPSHPELGILSSQPAVAYVHSRHFQANRAATSRRKTTRKPRPGWHRQRQPRPGKNGATAATAPGRRRRTRTAAATGDFAADHPGRAAGVRAGRVGSGLCPRAAAAVQRRPIPSPQEQAAGVPRLCRGLRRGQACPGGGVRSPVPHVRLGTHRHLRLLQVSAQSGRP